MYSAGTAIELKRRERASGWYSVRGLAFRVAGAVLLLLLAFPWYRLLELRPTGPSGEQTLRIGGQYYLAHWFGAGLVFLAVLGASRVLRPTFLAAVETTGHRWLLQPSITRVAAACALVATTASAAYSELGLGRRPILQDAVAQLIHARYLADGRLTGPQLEFPEFWQFQFMHGAAPGWVSQYPPGFAVALAAGWALGAAWLIGPLLLGLTVFFTTLSVDRLLSARPAAVRLGAVLMAVSPFLLFHAATFMSHVLVAALTSFALFASLRAVDHSRVWAIAAGAALGGAFLTRPYISLVLGPLVILGSWAAVRDRGRPDLRRRLEGVAATVAGAIPFAVCLLAYNARVFGHPFRLGYVAVAGPEHGLGFGMDPWGSRYGPAQALGATAVDLLGMSLDLLQGPFPVALLVVGLLVLSPALDPGVRLIAAWALVPVAANALYWHHDVMMGPRLLYEAAPAWCVMVALSALELVRQARERDFGGVVTASGIAGTMLLALAIGAVIAGPAKLATYTSRVASVGVPDGPTLIFVHEDWESRLGARLSALGMRLDSIRGALRFNATCRVETFVDRLEAERAARGTGTDLASTDDSGPLRFDPGGRQGLREVQMPSGAVIRFYDDEILTGDCEREAASDFRGVVALHPFLWQGDLPDLGFMGAMFVRDLGWDRNARLIERLAGREPLLLVRRGTEPPEVLPYDEGMSLLWPP